MNSLVRQTRAAANRSPLSSNNSNRNRNPGQAGKQQEEVDKKNRKIADDDTGTSDIGT
jgi:hypothetical protein